MNEILMKDHVMYNGKKCILSTCMFPCDTPEYETILMYQNGAEVDVFRTRNKENALKLHLQAANKLRNTKEREDGAFVGMLFAAQWGYEQTNITFFQIVELRGKQSVRVRQVCPECLIERPISGMSAYCTYKNGREILQPVRSSFIENGAEGDLKKIRIINGLLSFKISSYAQAYEYDGKELYKSWYY